MKKKTFRLVAFTFLLGIFSCTAWQALAQAEKASYPAMAPLDQYMIPNRPAEIALARSAAPKSISGAAEVLVLGPTGYTSAVAGTNGFVCMVQRSWAASTDFSEFWNSKIRSPICFNPAAARTYMPIILMKAKLVVARKRKAEIAQAVKSGLDSRELPPLEPGAMCYMMSKRQYLNDSGKSWYPHLMFFVQGDATKSWGANLPGSPMMATNDPEERVTIFMVWAGKWSDGTPAPPIVH
jgi:hypothetical protein